MYERERERNNERGREREIMREGEREMVVMLRFVATRLMTDNNRKIIAKHRLSRVGGGWVGAAEGDLEE